VAATGFGALVQDNSPFALTTAAVAGREQMVFRHGAKSLSDIYRKSMRAPASPFLVTDRASIGTAALFGRAGAYAALLAASGIGRNSRVAMALRDDADWIAGLIALTSLGATAVLVDGDDPARQIEAAGCTMALTDRAAGPVQIVGADALAAARNNPTPLLPCEIDPEQEACIAFTSGSSGDPKGAVLTHRGLTTGLMNMMLAGTAAARSTAQGKPKVAKPAPAAVLLRTPLPHVSAYMQILLMLMMGGRVIRSSRPDVCDLIHRHQITSITGVSDEEIAMLLAMPSSGALGPLRSIAAVGRVLPARLRRAVREALPDLGLGSGYGLTETSGLVCAIGNQELDARPRAVGPLLPTVECRILRADGRSAAAEESGEIWLRGAMLMRGYCNAPSHVMPDGWFATGDIGYLSADGMLNVLDKDDRFLVSDKGRISCRDIEDAARELPGIADIAVLAVPDRAGDRLVIVAAPGLPDFSDLRDFLALQFPARLIQQATFVSTQQLPRTSSGKIAYSRLLHDAVSG
jgi:acyl-CoA synthetase (AMP-forming)/AMP-acid ligase II